MESGLINAQDIIKQILKRVYLYVVLVEVDTKLPYCVKCGSPLKEDDKFCPVCGAPVVKISREEYTVSSNNLVDRVRELLHEGNVTRIIVKDNTDKTLVEIPATVGVVGVALAPWLMVLGVIAALVTNCKIVVERRG